MSKYLLEIGVEEFPSAYINSTKKQLEEKFKKLIEENKLYYYIFKIFVITDLKAFFIKIKKDFFECNYLIFILTYYKINLIKIMKFYQ